VLQRRQGVFRTGPRKPGEAMRPAFEACAGRGEMLASLSTGAPTKRADATAGVSHDELFDKRDAGSSREGAMRPRPLCKSAVVALVWVLLTTPATTLPLLFALDRPGSPLKKLQGRLSAVAMESVVGALLIGLPLLGIFIASFAMGRARSSWTPMRGGNLARMALLIGIVATIAAAALFIAGLRN
jgi:hypothetical protein